MDAILRALSIYFFLLLLFRAAGRRTLSQATTFDFVLLLIIGEATQQAMLGEDFSLTNSFLVILTLIFTDILLSLVKRRFANVEKWLDGVPVILVDNGAPNREFMSRARVGDEDILEAARNQQGLERMEQIKYAVLEPNGHISIIPKSR
jgi:uncharacterized membrane protein YcaP (DUF421 family)